MNGTDSVLHADLEMSSAGEILIEKARERSWISVMLGLRQGLLSFITTCSLPLAAMGLKFWAALIRPHQRQHKATSSQQETLMS